MQRTPQSIVRVLRWATTKAKRLRATQVAVLLCATFGLFFVCATPPLWGSDETFHIARIYQISRGHVFAKDLGYDRATGGYGGQTPENIYNLILNVNHDQMDNAETGTPFGTKNVGDASVYKELGQKPLENGKFVQYGFPNTAAYSPAAYAPDIVGMWIARLGDFTIQSTVILLRLLNLAVYVVAIYIAMRVLAQSRFKWIVFVIALLPMTLFEASIITADALTNAAVIVLSALLFRGILLRGRPFALWEATLLLGITVLLPLLKPGYLVLAPLILLIPASQFPRPRLGSIGKYAALGLTVVLFLAWTYATRGIADTAALIRPGPGWENVKPGEQMLFIIQHPLSYMTLFARTFLLEDLQYFTEMIGALGFNRVSVPGIVLVVEVALMAVAVAVTEKIALPKWKSWLLVAAVGAGGVMIATGMYITYADVAAPMLRGIQGRYFIPLLPVLLAAIAVLAGTRLTLAPQRHSYRLVAAGICVSTAVCLLLTAVKFYYVTWG
jgi:uncharacterized membrane protein